MTELHHGLSATPVMANQAVDTLSRIYNVAEDRGLIPEGSNPCRFTVKNRERKRERFLTDEEFREFAFDADNTAKGNVPRLLLAVGRRPNLDKTS